MAMAMAAAFPTSISGVVLNDVGPEVSKDGLSRIVDYVGKDHPQDSLQDGVKFLKTAMQNYPALTESDWLTIADGTFKRGKDGKYHVDWDPAIGRALRSDDGSEHDLWALFRSLKKVPVVAIRGALTDILSEGTFTEMANQHPHLTPVKVPDTGHVPKLTEPECLAAIFGLLKELDSTPH